MFDDKGRLEKILKNEKGELDLVKEYARLETIQKFIGNYIKSVNKYLQENPGTGAREVLYDSIFITQLLDKIIICGTPGFINLLETSIELESEDIDRYD